MMPTASRRARRVPRAAGGRCAPGFSTVELLVVVAIIGTLMAIAIPTFSDTVQSTRVTATANDLVASALRARSEAIKRNAIVTMCPSASFTECDGEDWSTGYILRCSSVDGTECDPTNAGTGILVLHQQAALRPGWRVTERAGIQSIAFQPTGTGATTAALTVCQYQPEAGRQERVVTIGPTGRPTVTKTANGLCP